MEKEKNNYPTQVYYPHSVKPKRIGKDEAMWLSDIMYDNMFNGIDESKTKPIPEDERAYREAKMKSFHDYRYALNNKSIPEIYRNSPSPNGMEPIENNQRAQMEVEQDIDYFRYINNMHGDKTQEARDQMYDEYQQMMSKDKYIFEQEVYEAKAESYQSVQENEDVLREFDDVRAEAESNELDSDLDLE